MRTTSSLSDMTLQMLMEMNEKAKRLCELMKQGPVEFVFKKVSTGKKRKARGTLKRDLIPPEFRRKKGRPKKRPDYLVIYYDFDKEDIRSFRDDLLQRIISKPEDVIHSTNKLAETEENEKKSKKKRVTKKRKDRR